MKTNRHHLPWMFPCLAAIVFASCLAIQPSAAQTPEEPDAALSIQDRVDNVFSIIVAQMERVLFWSPGLSDAYETEDGQRVKLDPEGYVLDSDSQARATDAQGNLFLFDLASSELRTIATDGTVLETLPGYVVARSVPLIVLVLAGGGLFFTIRYGFVNFRLFWHSVNVIRGKYDRPEHAGEVSHFKALTSALSATVGLGNIAGVALAIAMGGPGAVFWMWMTALFGMSTKFSCCALAQMYRRFDSEGRVLGGPMVYLEEGLKEKGPGFAQLGKFFAILFSVLTIFASMGGGNMFQANQTYRLFETQIVGSENAGPWLPWVFGIALAIPTGIVIIGGIRRIGDVTARMVPTMCLFYSAVCLTIVLLNLDKAPHMFVSIFQSAFSGEAMYGGFIGVMVQGMRRAAFSNEAGLGSAAIAHAAAKTDEPIREGVVAIVEPFIDTIVVCTMTALAILITEAHLNRDLEGVAITAKAFSQLGPVVPYILFIAVFVFAFSTVISWGYYGERASVYLFGPRGILPYRVVYVGVVVLGPVLSLQAVLGFSDMLLLSMAFPNIIGMVILSGKVKRALDEYTGRLKSGEMKMVEVEETV